ncbi:MAG TPA: hypothetical protein VII69_08405 [Candidatus Eremiobacteraceae bacterium]
MSRFTGIRSFIYRILAVTAVVAVAGVAATPMAPPARGDSPLRVAVYGFQNSASAPAATVNAMGVALYQAISTSGKFTAAGGGVLPLKLDVSGSSFGPALAAASKVGADDVVVGDIVQLGGGTISYSLNMYRVVDVALVRSQVFTQNYPASDAHSMSAAFASNVATLEAPRTAMGTIYSTYNGELDADLGLAEGFKLGQRFNVLRLGQKVAEADITKITDSYAVVSITNSQPGFKAQMGDRLVGIDPQPPVFSPHENTSGFSALYALLGLGAALVAIGQHGQAAALVPQPIASGGGSGSFTATGLGVLGTEQQQPITFTFTFSQPFDAATFDPANNLALAFCNVTSQGGTELHLSFLGTSTYLPSINAATSLEIVSDGILTQTDHVTFTFLDGSTNNWVDLVGDVFTGTTFSAFSIAHRPLAKSHRIAPRPIPPVVPAVPGKPIPRPTHQ